MNGTNGTIGEGLHVHLHALSTSLTTSHGVWLLLFKVQNGHETFEVDILSNEEVMKGELY